MQRVSFLDLDFAMPNYITLGASLVVGLVVLAVALVLGAASFLRTEPHPSSSTTTNGNTAEIVDLSQHFENTMLAGVNEPEEVW